MKVNVCLRWRARTLRCSWVGFFLFFVPQVLCSNSVLDSSEYWLRNDKALCRVGLLDDDTEGGCTVVSSTAQHSIKDRHQLQSWRKHVCVPHMIARWQSEFQGKGGVICLLKKQTLFSLPIVWVASGHGEVNKSVCAESCCCSLLLLSLSKVWCVLIGSGNGHEWVS